MASSSRGRDRCGCSLAACGTGGSTSGDTDGGDSGGGDSKTITWANWTLYLDYDEKSRDYPTLVEFEKETGYTVKIPRGHRRQRHVQRQGRTQLANGQNIGYDLVTLTDWLAAEWISKDFVSEINDANVPNKTNILPALVDVDFDPGANTL